MNGLIEIEGMEFYAYHGHFDVEKKVGNRFLVDVRIETNCEAAAKSDQLEDALDYQLVYQIIKEEMKIPSDLLENVCTRILSRLHTTFSEIDLATIKVSKMNPPMGGQIEKVSLTLSL
ncbi:dihydroneopterin aldolase [Sunxiuqinia sp. A32]|uniref:dihydroneopterin aldolase n=1 Tax=Sunxiuqinia sp. A32 TaxID=3461496 RepID=UPI0040459662